MKKNKKVAVIIISVILAIALLLTSAFFILSYIGKKQFHKKDKHIVNENVVIDDEDSITYNENEYVLNKNIISMLVIGVDRSSLEKDFGTGNNGQADVIFLATVDTKTKKMSIIPISRETMTDINIYTTDGTFAGTQKQPLCLAYAYGNTPEECSINIMTSVKRLLYEVNIDSYVTIDMNGVSKLTDMVGGIEVDCLENIKVGGKYVNAGEKLTLNGSKALDYVRNRGTDLEANNRRMQRQKQFLSALISKTGNSVLNDFTNLATYYTNLTPYFSTNISFAQITYLAQNFLSMNLGDSLEYKNVEGTLAQGEKWVEFTADENSLLQTVIDVFYTPKKSNTD